MFILYIMIYLVCPTCGSLLGEKSYIYENKKEAICSNEKLSEEEKSKELEKLINSLNFRRYCCKMRVMTGKDIAQDIIPVPPEDK